MTEPIINPDTIRQMEELFSNTQNPDNELQKQVRKVELFSKNSN